MRKLLLNLTTSLDGYIADEAGGIDWLLPLPPSLPPDYLELMAGIDTLVMGRVTYEASLALEGGSAVFDDKRVVVFTSRHDLASLPGVEFISQPPEAFVTQLKAEDGGMIWLFGGGRLASTLVDAGLVDEYLIAVQPILLGAGIPLWRSPFRSQRLRLTLVRAWPDGLVELRYESADSD